ncbi:hypothetical protein C1S70_07470 (plasmid) [Azospirillum argentinense]|uniref:Uncharacterized protein n=1 Tax=Azospirillum argentinense TaxID=2970906 RepID=A0A2K1G3M9_9PROT|nr:hypothetical protein C1S70_07470 [Azospirillum argentinense]
MRKRAQRRDPLSRPGRGWPEGPGEGRARIKALILVYTLTLPPLRGGPLPLPGRERENHSGLTPPGSLSAPAPPRAFRPPCRW